MLTIELVLVGGIGYVVPLGGLETTGVLELLFVLLQALSNTRLQRIAARFLPQRRKGAKVCPWFSLAPLRLCGRNIFLAVIVDVSTLTWFLRDRLAGHTILTLNPPAEINKLTSFTTEGTERIVFPLDWLTAGWALHES